MSRNYKYHNPAGTYFVSFATINWIDLFIRECYVEVFIEELKYTIENKGMILHAYCIMPSHVHLVFEAKNGNPGKMLGELKSATSKTLRKLIQANPSESRKPWILKMMYEFGQKNGNVKYFQLWQQNNHPIEIRSNEMIDQKINYVHNNPVESGFVEQPEDWKHSSAKTILACWVSLEIGTLRFLNENTLSWKVYQVRTPSKMLQLAHEIDEKNGVSVLPIDRIIFP